MKIDEGKAIRFGRLGSSGWCGGRWAYDVQPAACGVKVTHPAHPLSRWPRYWRPLRRVEVRMPR